MNNDEMSELFSKIGDMVNSGNIPDNIKNILSSISSNNNEHSESSRKTDDTSSIDLETILKIKSIIEKMNSQSDPRSNLLLSLKPYLNDSRKDKVDQYIKLFSMGKAFEMFNDLDKK